MLCRQAFDAALNIEDDIDPPYGFHGERRPPQTGQVKEFTPPVGPTRCFGDRAGLASRGIEVVESGIGIGLKDPSIGGQVSVRILTAAIA